MGTLSCHPCPSVPDMRYHGRIVDGTPSRISVRYDPDELVRLAEKLDVWNTGKPVAPDATPINEG